MSATPATAMTAPTTSNRRSRSPSQATPSATPNTIDVRDRSDAVPGST